MNALGIITAVGQMLADRSRWCQGHLAVNKRGEPCTPSSRAKRFDPIGASYAVAGVKLSDDSVNRHTNEHAAAVAIMQGTALRLHGMSLEQVNDKLGHDAVLEVLRRSYGYAKAVAGDVERADAA